MLARRTARRACALLSALAIATLGMGCSAPQAQVELVRIDKRPLPTPAPTPTSTPTPATLPPASPFSVQVTDVILASTSNAAMFAAPEPAADELVVQTALEAARLKCEAYLNAMFVNAQTRFSRDAVAQLVDLSLISEDALPGLGVLSPDVAVLGTRTGEATALADVHVDVATIGAVTLAFSATTDLVVEGAEGPVRQEGYMSVVDRGAGPEVILLTATTTFGGTLPEVLG